MGGHMLPELPYAYDALEPHLDARTLEIHHARHHQSHVDLLNATVDQLHPSLRELSPEDLLRQIEDVPEDYRTAVRNHAGGTANHSLFWRLLSPGGGRPSGALAEAIDDNFGSLEEFQGKFSAVAANHFGSGWAWLFMARKRLVIYSLPNQDSPLMVGETPLLGLDLWEHSYCLKYEWRRLDYIDAFWNVVNWDEVGRRYEAVLERSGPKQHAHHG